MTRWPWTRKTDQPPTWNGLSPEVKAFGQALVDAGLATEEQRDAYLASLERAFINRKRERHTRTR